MIGRPVALAVFLLLASSTSPADDISPGGGRSASSEPGLAASEEPLRSEPRPNGMLALSILYAGNPGSDREKDYVTFLRASFQQVATTDYRTFKEEQAAGHDVVIFDWTSIFPRDRDGKIEEPIKRLNWPKAPAITEAYSRPTLLVGAPGQEVIRPFRWKIDNLCQCLGDSAHEIASGHEIFRTPLKVDLTITDAPSPPHYAALSAGQAVGKRIMLWKVQTRDFPAIDPGLVSSPFGFEDSPDAEIISSGLNEKTPGSVALGRQGNFFLWGFSASPSDMTPEARKCFINSVCYIKKFDGRRPIARKAEREFSREYALVYACSLKEFRDDEALARMFPVLRKDPTRIKGVRESERKLFEGSFARELRERLGEEPERYADWVRANYEWLRPGEENAGLVQIAVDEDAKALGLSNRKPEILETCVSMLERGDRPEVALRILKRYTSEDFAEARKWRSWLDSVRGRLYFDEVGRFKFAVAPADLPAPARLPRTPLTTRRSPTRQEPVVVEAECVPDRVHPGESFTLVLRVETAPAWHITAARGSMGAEVATSVELALPREIMTEGDWIYPEPTPGASGRLTHEGAFEFRRRLRVASDAKLAPIECSAKFSYQACDRFSCRAADEAILQLKLTVAGE